MNCFTTFSNDIPLTIFSCNSKPKCFCLHFNMHLKQCLCKNYPIFTDLLVLITCFWKLFDKKKSTFKHNKQNYYIYYHNVCMQTLYFSLEKKRNYITAATKFKFCACFTNHILIWIVCQCWTFTFCTSLLLNYLDCFTSFL